MLPLFFHLLSDSYGDNYSSREQWFGDMSAAYREATWGAFQLVECWLEMCQQADLATTSFLICKSKGEDQNCLSLASNQSEIKIESIYLKKKEKTFLFHWHHQALLFFNPVQLAFNTLFSFMILLFFVVENTTCLLEICQITLVKWVAIANLTWPFLAK